MTDFPDIGIDEIVEFGEEQEAAFSRMYHDISDKDVIPFVRMLVYHTALYARGFDIPKLTWRWQRYYEHKQ